MKFLDENHLKSVPFICIGQSMLLISLCTYAISVLQNANSGLIMIMSSATLEQEIRIFKSFF